MTDLNKPELKAKLKVKTDELVSRDKELFATLSKVEVTDQKKVRVKDFREKNRELIDDQKRLGELEMVDKYIHPKNNMENMSAEEIDTAQKKIEDYIEQLKKYKEKLTNEKNIQEISKAIECSSEIPQESYDKAKKDIDSRYGILKGDIFSARRRNRNTHNEYYVRDMISDPDFVKGIVSACKKEDIETVEKSLCMIEACVKLRHFDDSNSHSFLNVIAALKRNPDFKAISTLIYDTGSSLINKNREDMKKYFMSFIEGKEKERIQTLVDDNWGSDAKYFMAFVGSEKEKIESLIDEYLNNDSLGSQGRLFYRIQQICYDAKSD